MAKDKKGKTDDTVSEEDVSRREFFVKALASAPIAAGVAVAANSALAEGRDPPDDEDDREDDEED